MWQQYAQQPQPYYDEQHSITQKPPVSESYTWQDPAGQHMYQHNANGYQQDHYSTTLATIAAAKERWGNTTRWGHVCGAVCLMFQSSVALHAAACTPHAHTLFRHALWKTEPAASPVAQVSRVAAATGGTWWRGVEHGAAAEQQQQQPAAGAQAGQQYYGGPAGGGGYQGHQQSTNGGGPAAGQHMQAGGTTFTDRYGQREPDYSYYSGR